MDTRASSETLPVLLSESRDIGFQPVPCPRRLHGFGSETRIYSGQVEVW